MVSKATIGDTRHEPGETQSTECTLVQDPGDGYAIRLRLRPTRSDHASPTWTPAIARQTGPQFGRVPPAGYRKREVCSAQVLEGDPAASSQQGVRGRNSPNRLAPSGGLAGGCRGLALVVFGVADHRSFVVSELG